MSLWEFTGVKSTYSDQPGDIYMSHLVSLYVIQKKAVTYIAFKTIL